MTTGEKIIEFFKDEKIKYYSCLPVEECVISTERKLPDLTASVCFFLIPYNVSSKEEGNISLYAVPRDYHLYIKELSERFYKKYPDESVLSFFADNSPFSERGCAERAHLGRVGKNGLLINSEYGSYTFIGSICLSVNISISHPDENYNSKLCKNCEKCKVACPVGRNTQICLSELTQKKRLTPEEEKIVASYPVRWGCDICQRVCPENIGVSDTPIDFFREKRIEMLTYEALSKMSPEELSERAYSWRGRAVIERNIKL